MENQPPTFVPLTARNLWLRLSIPVLLAVALTTLILFLPVWAAHPQPTPANPADFAPWLNAMSVKAAGNLTITKSVTPTQTVNQGELITYTLVVTNNTTDSLNFLIVQDQVPANSSCDPAFSSQVSPVFDSSGGRWLGGCSGSAVIWNYVNISGSNPGASFEPGEVVTLTFRVQVDQPLRNRVDIITNDTYEALSGSPDYTVAGTDSITHLVLAPEWDITKTVTPSQTVQPGQNLTYTLTVTNVGDFATNGPFTLTEVLPQHTNFVTATEPVTLAGNSLTWVQTNSLEIDQSFSVTLVVSVTRPLTDAIQLINNDYQVSGGSVFTDGIGAPVAVTVDAPVTLEVQKTAPASVQAGDLLTYTITITNATASSSHADGLVFTDTLPANTLYVDHGFGGSATGTLTTGGPVVTWTVQSPDPLPIGQSVELTLAVRVQSPLTNGTVITNSLYGPTVTNTLFVAPPTPVTTTVNSAPIITLTKTVTPQIVLRGQPVTYTITVTNTGNETAVNLPFTDAVQAPDFTPAQATWSLTVPGKNLTGTIGVVSYTLAMTAGNTPGEFPNYVTTTVRGVPIEIGPVATVTVRGDVDLQISKARLGSDEVITGDPITYTLTLTNASPETADAIVTDTFTNAAVLTYTVAYPGASCGLSGGDVRCSIPALNGTTSITVVLETSASISGVVTNTAVITTGIPGQGDSDTLNNSSTVTTPVRYPRADLSISKARLGSGEVLAGDAITYTLTLTNSGPDTVDAVVTDTFTGTVTSISSNTSQGNICSDAASPIVCNFSGFTGTATITVVLQTATSFSGTLTNTAEISFAAGFTAVELDPADNVVDPPVVTPVRLPRADLSISKARLGSGVLVQGEAITYTLTLTNAPGSETVPVVVSDVFTNAAYSSHTITYAGASCIPAGQQLNCSLPSFTGTTVITLVLNTAASISGTITNTANITFAASFTAEELDPANNVVDPPVVTAVRYPTADLSISKVRLGSNEVLAGDAITYTLNLTNSGPDTVDAVVTDTFTGTVVSISSNTSQGNICSDAASPIVCNFNGFTGTATITVVLQTAPSFSGTLTNTARIAATAANAVDPPANNSDTVTTPVRQLVADLQIAKTGPGFASAGDSITYTVVIANPGDAVDVVITDTFSYGSRQSVTPSPGGSCNSSGPISCQFDAFTGSAVITVVLNTSNVSSDNSLVNTAAITTTQPNAIDPNPGNNSDYAVTLVTRRRANLQMEKTLVGSSPVLAGERVTYTLRITNTGPDAVSATLNDTATPLAAVTGIQVASPTGWSCSAGVNSISCNNPQFGLESQTFTVVLTTSAAFAGTLTNKAGIDPASPAFDPAPDDNNAEVNVTVALDTTPLLTITKTANPAAGSTVSPGQTIRYTLSVSNIGNGPASSVVITDDLDSGVAFVNGSGSSNGSFSENGGQVTVSQAALAAGQALTATWEVTVTASTSGTTLSNTANAASASTPVIASNLVAHTVVTQPVTGPTTLYLPIIHKNCCTANLVIDSFTVNTASTPPTVQVVVKNIGLGATDSGFWVDLYVNPNPLPVSLLNAANPGDRRWQRLRTNVDQGIAWEIVTPLAAGSSITLTQTSPQINAAQTKWSGLPAGTHNFYAFADSFDADDNRYVQIDEGSDANELDNQAGPQVSTLSLADADQLDAASAPAVADPPRRDVGR